MRLLCVIANNDDELVKKLKFRRICKKVKIKACGITNCEAYLSVRRSDS